MTVKRKTYSEVSGKLPPLRLLPILSWMWYSKTSVVDTDMLKALGNRPGALNL